MIDDIDIGIDWGIEEDPGIDWGVKVAPVSAVIESVPFKAREYQTKTADAIREAFREYRKIFIELATGTGKTVIFSAVCKEHKEQNLKCLVIAHRDELIEQARDKMYRFYGIDAGKEKAEDKGSIYDDVVVASVQTLQSDTRLHSWPSNHFDLVIVDECHRSLAASYQKILNYFYSGGAKILGVTATADRGDKRNLGEFYEHCAYEYNLLDACKDGYLVAPVVVQIPIQIDLKGVKNKRTPEGSDLDVTEVARRIQPLLDPIAEAIKKEAPNRKTLIFMPSIATAKMIAESMQKIGLEADYVSGECKDRKQKIADYKDGKIQYLCNAMLLTEGFDDDNTACITVLRPTKIRSFYAQCIGRGSRPLTELIDTLETVEERLQAIKESSKPNLLILDFLWATDKLDLVNPVDLVTGGRKEIRSRMLEGGGQGNLIEMQEEAEKDMLANLEANVRKNSKKKKRVIDPLQFAVITGDAFIADWEPTEPWHKEEVSQGQKDALVRAGIDAEAVAYKGLASSIIGRLFKRQQLGLATPRQLKILSNFKFNNGSHLTIEEATAIIGKLMAAKTSDRREAIRRSYNGRN